MKNWLKIILISFSGILILQCQVGKRNSADTQRIISLSPHITEIVYALGAQDQLVAVTDFCRYPPAALQQERIGGLIDPNIEKIVALKPTMLFGVPAHAELNEKLHRFGLKIRMYPNETWKDMLNTIDSIAVKTGRQDQGNALVSRLSRSLEGLHQTGNDPQPAVLLLIGHEKGSLRNATVAGPNTFIDEMLYAAGGSNIYADLGIRYGTVSIESMISRSPEIVIDLAMEGERQIDRLEVNETWSVLSTTPAFRKKQIFRIGGDHTLIPGPRMLWLAQDFRAVLDSVRGGQP
jgi:iron complex transport system substrate-binding protein